MENGQWHRANLADAIWAMKLRILFTLGVVTLVLWFVGGNPRTVLSAISFIFLMIVLFRYLSRNYLNDWLTCQCGKTFAAKIVLGKNKCPKCDSVIPPEFKR